MDQWPGVHCVKSLLSGEPATGYWFDQTQEYAAKRRGETFDRMRYATPEVLVLSPLPCWRHVSEEVQRQLVVEMIADIESEAALRRRRSGSRASSRRPKILTSAFKAYSRALNASTRVGSTSSVTSTRKPKKESTFCMAHSPFNR